MGLIMEWRLPWETEIFAVGLIFLMSLQQCQTAVSSLGKHLHLARPHRVPSRDSICATIISVCVCVCHSVPLSLCT